MVLKSVPRIYIIVVIIMTCFVVGWTILEGRFIFLQSSKDAPNARDGVEDSTSLDGGAGTTRPSRPGRVTVTFLVEGQGSIAPGVGQFIYNAWQDDQEECLNACESPSDYHTSTCECVPFVTEATAIPAEGWLFVGWNTDSGEHEEKSAATLQFRPIFTQRVTARFIPANDVAELDLVEAALTFFDETVDANGVSGVSSESEPRLGGNRIPDIRNFACLNTSSRIHTST